MLGFALEELIDAPHYRVMTAVPNEQAASSYRTVSAGERRGSNIASAHYR